MKIDLPDDVASALGAMAMEGGVNASDLAVGILRENLEACGYLTSSEPRGEPSDLDDAPGSG